MAAVSNLREAFVHRASATDEALRAKIIVALAPTFADRAPIVSIAALGVIQPPIHMMGSTEG